MGDDFHTTRWSVVLAAGSRETAESREALAALCETYWFPLYAYARRRTGSRDRAEDLTQGFFAELLEKGWVATADPGRGRFRAFLLTALKRHMGHAAERERALKRGGGRPPLRLDFEDGERRYSLEPVHDLTPDRVFERRWALTLLDRVLGRLGEEMEKGGRAEAFAALRTYLTGEGPAHRETAKRLGMSEGAVKTAVHRLRRRYRELLRAEIAETVAEPAEVDDEIRHLLGALGGGA
ncbi:MAG: RNA polymerase sigma factor [Planctomycetota bacterium]|jgi:RNA polymerase sigma-70 factor (ECF subfamily)